MYFYCYKNKRQPILTLKFFFLLKMESLDGKFDVDSRSFLDLQSCHFERSYGDRAKNSTRLLSYAIYAPRYATPLYFRINI
uniref:Ovule protein n=1 Tax=Heterorhabditis bacteriophora TaxID=37862 RepID=A0A1I7WA92_HETBA